MLLRHSVLYLLARGLPGIVNFLAISVYSRLLTPDEYGRYALVIAWVGLLNVVFFQWLRLSLLRFLPTHLENPEPLLSTVLAGFSVLALLSGALGLLLAIFWPDPEWRGLILFSVLLLWVQAWFELNLELVRSRLQPVRYGLMSGVKAVSALALGTLAVHWGMGAYGPLFGLLVGMLLAGLSWGWLEWKGTKFVVSGPLLREFLYYGLPLSTTAILGFVVSASDRFLISAFLDEGSVGTYAVGYDLAQQTLTVIFMTINLAATPLAIKALEKKGVEAARHQFTENGRLFLYVTLPTAVALVVLKEPLFHTIVGVKYQEMALEVFPWIVIAAFLQGLKSYYVDSVFYLTKRTMLQVWTVVPSAVLNIILNLLLIPHYGIVGSAYATLICYALGLTLSLVLTKKVMFYKFPLSDLAKSSVATVVMVLTMLWVKSYFHINLFFMVVIGILFYSGVILLLNIKMTRRAWSKCAILVVKLRK